MADKPRLGPITRRNGVAGQASFTVTVFYPDEPQSSVEFVGFPHYGGPVVMITESGTQVFVKNPERFGPFGKEWVRKFFEEAK